MARGRILSGMRPTGRLHLGNYLGALENWVNLQDDFECFFTIVDWHALTTGYKDTGNIKNDINEMAIDWIASGLDPEKSVIFVQSAIKEHAELHLLLSMITPLGWLERCPTYKDQLQQLEEREISTYGFLGYPVLQAADIMVYKADTVPVGEDQIPHIELTREIVRRFNYLYKEVFPEPKERMNKVTLLCGNDGRKMSKSYGNAINLSATNEEITSYISNMITDPERIRKTDPGHPEVCSVFSYQKVFNVLETPEIESACKSGSIGCVSCKKNLAAKLCAFMAPIQDKRQMIAKDKDYITQVLNEGSKKARSVASQTLLEVKEAMNI